MACTYDAIVEVEVSNVIATVDATGDTTDDSSWTDSFSLNLFDSNFETVRDNADPLIVGTMAYASVEWDVDTLG